MDGKPGRSFHFGTPTPAPFRHFLLTKSSRPYLDFQAEDGIRDLSCDWSSDVCSSDRSEEHTSELQSHDNLVCRLLLGVQTCALPDRKSTRLNSSHTIISYAVFCLK